LHVLTAAHIAAAAATSEHALEAPHAAKVAHVDVERLTEINVLEAAEASATRWRGSVSVEMRALVGIGQDLIRLADLLEPRLGLRTVVAIRMEFLRQPAVGLLDVVVACIAGHSQRGVVVTPSTILPPARRCVPPGR